MRQITVSLFILLTIYLTQTLSTQASPYETEVVFYHEQVFPKDFYWLVMQIEERGRMQEVGDKSRSGLSQLARKISVVKDIVDEYNNNKLNTQQSNMQQIISMTTSTNTTIYPTQDEQLTLIIDNDNQQDTTQAFSTKLTDLSSHLNHFQLTLSSMDIHINAPYSITQEVYLRVPIERRLQLTQLVDCIQQEFTGSEGFRILSVEIGNKNSYSMVWAQGNKKKLYEENVRQLINEHELVAKINKEAETYCGPLNMELNQIKSFHPLMGEALHNNLTLQQPQLLNEQPQQLPYEQAYDIVSNRQFDDYENVFYEVKVICKGNQRPKRVHEKQTQSEKIKVSNRKYNRNKNSKKDKIQQEIHKLNNIIQNQNNN